LLVIYNFFVEFFVSSHQKSSPRLHFSLLPAVPAEHPGKMSLPDSSQNSSSLRPVVLVTGEAGYDVIATDIKPLDSVKEDVEKLGAVCLALHLDVTDSESVEKGMYFSIKG
jgi:hypothetical protein